MEHSKTVVVLRYEDGVRVTSVSPGPFYETFHNTIPEFHTGVWRENNRVSWGTPDYKGKISRGEILPGHEFLDYDERTSGALTYSHWESDFPGAYKITTRTVPYVLFRPKGVQSTINFSEASNSFLKKVKGKTWQAGVAWAEARKTSTLITNTASRLAYVARSLRKGQLGNAANALGIVPSGKDVKRFHKAYGKDPRSASSSMWLEMQYGWKPLLSDVKSAAETLAYAMDRPEARTIRLRDTYNRSGSIKDDEYRYESGPDRYGQRHTYYKQTYITTVLYMPDLAVETLQKAELLNPLSIAWELVPYSFVVDWFLPIGDWLNVLDATVGKSFQRGTSSVRVQEVTTLFDTHSGAASLGQGGQIIWDVKYKKRETLPDFPAPSLPSFEPKLGTEKMVSALALLSQSLSKLGH